MTKSSRSLVVVFMLFVLVLLAGCGTSSSPDPAPTPLSAKNVNLIFVASEDLQHHGTQDINDDTANLTSQGLQRTLLLGTYLKQNVLGGKAVTAIYALEPMTHLQTTNKYPDMAPLMAVQQFAMLNQVSTSINGGAPVTGNSFPIFASYADSAALPNDVAQPVFSCPGCQGLDFTDQNGANEALVEALITAKSPGYFVFSAPWDTVSAMMSNINASEGFGLALPSSYGGPDHVYAISIAPSGTAALVGYNADLHPGTSYPALPAGKIASARCQGTYSVSAVGGAGGAVVPANTNVNETVYMIRHAEAHPAANWDDGNYVAAGQWRALDLPNALAGKIHPDQVIAIDPAIGIPGTPESITSSYIRPAMTVEPYAIANNLPYNLASSVAVFSQNAPQLATKASNYLFTNGTFSNHVLLVAWEHKHVPPTINALLYSYGVAQNAPLWNDEDYDSIWTVRLDAQGNLSIDNLACEGIDSTSLPATAPQF
ncbi:hypothetical protein Acid345_1111 [Candidatus Koribacter versatilis Ellin345]|uniref:Lipoprotein n=1 Tax=Koribacter versatilis (strain Ellin345) TaxID=204669 RepID=Q1ISN6_KORVE|nr:hypothetical protein [Candidatus Koribacter versatilis]ABF40114.1 hypothetical protein Acid345_1111 [Candidatus Koribacter versatilis Ellin345]